MLLRMPAFGHGDLLRQGCGFDTPGDCRRDGDNSARTTATMTGVFNIDAEPVLDSDDLPENSAGETHHGDVISGGLVCNSRVWLEHDWDLEHQRAVGLIARWTLAEFLYLGDDLVQSDDVLLICLRSVVRKDFSNELEFESEDVVGALRVVAEDAAHRVFTAHEVVLVELHGELALARIFRAPALTHERSVSKLQVYALWPGRLVDKDVSHR